MITNNALNVFHIKSDIKGVDEAVRNLQKIINARKKIARYAFFKAIRIYRRKAAASARRYYLTGRMSASYREAVTDNKSSSVTVSAGPAPGFPTAQARWLERGTKVRLSEKEWWVSGSKRAGSQKWRDYGKIKATWYHKKAWMSTRRTIWTMVKRDIWKGIKKEIRTVELSSQY